VWSYRDLSWQLLHWNYLFQHGFRWRQTLGDHGRDNDIRREDNGETRQGGLPVTFVRTRRHQNLTRGRGLQVAFLASNKRP
jgi:hypothetical protein